MKECFQKTSMRDMFYEQKWFLNDMGNTDVIRRYDDEKTNGNI
jgi:hypothetical protein